MRNIKLAYNNAYRIVMNYQHQDSAPLMFLYTYVYICNENVNNLTIILRKSYNSLINGYEFLVIR